VEKTRPVIVVYHPKYLVGTEWINRRHPFEVDRALQVVALLRQELGEPAAQALLRVPEARVSRRELAEVHDRDYLAVAHHSEVVARVIEVPALRRWPRFLVRWWLIDPILWCMAGTLLAAREVFREGVAFNLGGGFHHAKREGGEGFCLFSDIALAIHTLRAESLLTPWEPIFYIDTDVHQGNGVSTYFADDPAVRILDVYNSHIYPFRDRRAVAGIDVARPLPSGTGDQDYLSALESGLDELFAEQPLPRLVIYNAGTDVFCEDLLGELRLTRQGVNRRDQMVLEAVRGRGIPMLVLASGGYSKTSARLVTDFILRAAEFERERG
jgi:histone deacetylase 11